MRHLTFIAFSLLATVTIKANGTRLPSQDATAVARGYAWIATADNPSAIYYNPAGLAYLNQPTIQASAHFLHTSGSYSNPVSSAELESRTSVLPAVFASQPIVLGGHSYTLGVGAFAPFGSESNWPSNGPFALAVTSNKVTFLRYSLGFATQITKYLSVGATFQWNEIETDLHRAAGIVPGDDFGFTGKGSTGSYSLGLMYRPSERHSFGLQFQSQTKFGIDGTTLIMPFNLSEPGRVDWPFPSDLSMGYSFRPNQHWNLEISYDVTFWSALDTITLNRPVSGPLPIPFNWSDSGYFGIGGTYRAGAFRYSAGINYSQNSVSDQWFSPSVPDTDRWLINANIGYDSVHWTFEGLVQGSPDTTRTVRGNILGGLVDGEYRGSLFGLTLQAKYRW